MFGDILELLRMQEGRKEEIPDWNNATLQYYGMARYTPNGYEDIEVRPATVPLPERHKGTGAFENIYVNMNTSYSVLHRRKYYLDAIRSFTDTSDFSNDGFYWNPYFHCFQRKPLTMEYHRKVWRACGAVDCQAGLLVESSDKRNWRIVRRIYATLGIIISVELLIWYIVAFVR